jgi:hypothetical protein
MKMSEEPRLASPGEGLPALELQIGRLIFGFRRFAGSRSLFLKTLAREESAIGSLIESFPASRRGERILIPRPVGLEDSSRNQSAWMVLDHLRIVNTACAEVIGQLSCGMAPAGEVSTAAVKASPAVGPEVEPEFSHSCRLVARAIEESPELRTTAHYAHPWFGPLDAHGWAAMAAMHMGLHRYQLALMLRCGK